MATITATVRRATVSSLGKGEAGQLRAHGARTIETPASMVSGTVIDFNLRLASGLRLDALSRIFWDDLASSGSPTLSIGLYGVDGNTADVTTALASGLDISAASAAYGQILPTDYANAGKMLWELAGLSSDPGGFYDVKGLTAAATANQAGTITLDLKTYSN